jgi:hypothetical protein
MPSIRKSKMGRIVFCRERNRNRTTLHPALKPLQILLAILLIGAGATVVGVAGYRYSKSSAVKASPAPRVVAAVNPPESGLKEGGRMERQSTLPRQGRERAEPKLLPRCRDSGIGS